MLMMGSCCLTGKVLKRLETDGLRWLLSCLPLSYVSSCTEIALPNGQRVSMTLNVCSLTLLMIAGQGSRKVLSNLITVIRLQEGLRA